MIDNIKIMNTDFNPNLILNKYKWKVIDFDDDEIPELKLKEGLQANITNKSRMFSLRMLLTKNLKTKTYTLSINGSIRKWYFDKNCRKDLSYLEFVDCIEILGSKLSLKKGEIWSLFKITNLEIGITLLLKSSFRNIMDCFVKYRNAKRDSDYETSVYFKFNNYEILFYDKFIEMNRGKNWTKKEKNVFNKFHFFRYEISVTKVSATIFKKKFDTLELLKKRWDKIPIVLEKYLEKIEFVDLLSKEKIVEPISLSEYNNYIKYMGMKSIGIHKTIMDFDKLKIPNNKSKYFKDLMGVYKSNISRDIDYKAVLMFEFRKKVDRLYNKSYNRYI